MKIIVIALFLSVLTAAAPCGKGGLPCDQGKCHYPTYIEGCLNYGPNDLCAQCEYNYQLINGRCFFNPKSQTGACCLVFRNDGKCQECAGGLQLDPVSELCEDKKIEGCLKKGQQGCQICAKDYDLVGGICIPEISRCSQYDSQFNCITCQGSAKLVNGACLPQIQVKTIPNCQQYNDYGCSLCQNGYLLTPNLLCQPAPTGCQLINSNGQCLLCQAPFYQLTNGTCAVVGCTGYSQGKCTCCDQSLGFKLVNGRCQIDHCIYFDPKGCSQCEEGFVASVRGCLKPEGKVCLICKSDQFLGADGQCHQKDVHCVGYKDGRCIKCCQGYFLDSSFICQLIQPGCIYSNGVCSSCSAPFKFYNGKCLIDGCIKYCAQGCLSCDSRLQLIGNVCGLPHCSLISNFQCKQCQAGFELNQEGRCVVADPYCAVRNSLNICVKCKEGYHLDQERRCSALKLGCNYVDGRCTSCRAPFVYVPEREACEIDGCLKYFVGGCQKCESGYSLLYNTCKLPNCLVSKKGKCLECDPDYVFKEDGTCVSKDQFCEKMDQYGTCIKCMDSYYYSQKLDRCVKKSPGCQYDNNDNCISCYAPFTHEPGRCVIKGCLRFDDKGCYQCKYPFALTKQNTCAIAHCTSYAQDGRCNSCQQGYALSQDFLCKIEDQYCAQYDQARTTCLKCVKGYYVDAEGRCQYADKHCSTFDETGICVNCDRLYFLNPFGKCQLRDPQCDIYTNGMCSLCRNFYFPKEGYCMANLPGCKVQKAYGKCLECDSGHKLFNGECRAEIKKLTWNSFDMDFFDDDNSCDKAKSKSVFSVGVDSKLNLLPAFPSNSQGLFYSSWALNSASILLSAAGNNGWSPSGNCQGQYVGFKAQEMQTFYACDVKQLTGSSLKSFDLEYSMDGKTFLKIDTFFFSTITIGSISTFYFKPVYGQYIRLVVKEGTPNIRMEFYFSSDSLPDGTQSQGQDTYIGKTVAASIDGVEEGGISDCSSDGLCWAGLESCQPRKIKGFSLDYSQGCSGQVQEVKIEYSTDGITFNCFNKCDPLKLANNKDFVFSPPLLAQKMHVHFSKYSGKPKFGVKFQFV